jgi:hypothetical protein
MGKSFNDDVFNTSNDIVINSITGRTFSKEAIEENKEETTTEPKTETPKISKPKKAFLDDTTKEDDDYIKLALSIAKKSGIPNEMLKNNGVLYVKKTYIIKKEYIDLIEGLSILKDKQQKDVVNEIFKHALEDIDQETKDKALKEYNKRQNKLQNQKESNIF